MNNAFSDAFKINGATAVPSNYTLTRLKLTDCHFASFEQLRESWKIVRSIMRKI